MVIAALPDTAQKEEKRLHKQDTIRGNVRHGTKRWQQRMELLGAQLASPTVFSGATIPG